MVQKKLDENLSKNTQVRLTKQWAFKQEQEGLLMKCLGAY